MKAVQCTQCFPPFREEILAHGRHMVQFTLGGGRRSPGPASINTFLVKSLIAVRYRKPPRARRDMTQVCLQLITQRERSFSQKEKKNRHVPRPPLPVSSTCLEPQRGRSSSGALLQRRSGSGGDLFPQHLFITKRERRWTSGGRKMRPRSRTCSAQRLEVVEGHSFCNIFTNYIPPPPPSELAALERWGGEDGLFVVSPPREMRGILAAYATCRLSPDGAEALSITGDLHQ